MSESAPLVDHRTFKDIVNDAKVLAEEYCPGSGIDWKLPGNENDEKTKDPGMAMVYLFAHLMEIIISRLNQVPDKHFLAFLDMVGTRLLPAAPAKALLQFKLSAGTAANGFVPAGTQVAGQPTGSQDPINFETQKDLVVTPVQLKECYTLDPGNDRYDNPTAIVTCSETGECEMFNGKDLIQHIIYIGDDRIFGFTEKEAKVTLKFTFQDENHGFQNLSLLWEYSLGEEKWQTLAIDQKELQGNPLAITFDNPKDIARDIVFDHEHYWIRISLDQPLLPVQSPLVINNITGGIEITGAGILPGACFMNQLPIDPPQNFYPFGPVPTNQYIFYIGSEQVFTKPGAEISIIIEFDQVGVQGSKENLELSWEYWDGTMWQSISNITDPTKNFTKSPGNGEKITFTCPKIEQKEVNLLTGHWVRIRVSSGHYGIPPYPYYDDGKVKLTTGSLKPPKIERITLGYSYTPGSTGVETVVLKNNFQYQEQETGPDSFFSPFKPIDEEFPAFYLGFDAPFANDAVSLYFQLAEAAEIQTGPVKINPLQGSSAYRQYQWQYFNGAGWARLNIADETRDLNQPGHVTFIGPKDFERDQRFGIARHWVRVCRAKETGIPSPKLGRIFLNTVWAGNGKTIKNEVLGSGSGRPDQVFTLKKSPVLPGQQIWVKELEIPSLDEKNKILEEEGPQALQLITLG